MKLVHHVMNVKLGVFGRRRRWWRRWALAGRWAGRNCLGMLEEHKAGRRWEGG